MDLRGAVEGLIKLEGGGSEVEVSPILTEGTKIATITVDTVTYDLYAPEGGGSEVDITQVLSTGQKIATISVDDVATDLFAPIPPQPTEVDVTQMLQQGEKIATITVDDVPTDIYAPESTEVTVTQVISQGEKIATISVDGVSTDIYAPSGGGGGGVNYSTSEIKVGTYIDGANTYDLYEKTYIITLTGAVTQVSLADLNILKTVHIYGKIYNNSDEIIMPFYENSTYNGRTKYNKGNKMLQIILSNDSFSYYPNAEYNIFYIKNI